MKKLNIFLFIIAFASCSDGYDNIYTTSDENIIMVNSSINELHETRGLYNNWDHVDSLYIPVNGNESINGRPFLLTTIEDNITDIYAASSRGINISNIFQINDINVLAYNFSGEYSNVVSPTSYIDNSTFSYIKNKSIWESEKPYFWKYSDQSLRFYMTNIESSTLTINKTKFPYINYTVSSEIGNQKDLLVAGPIEKPMNYKKNVDVSFYHGLTSVTFSVSNKSDSCHISKIELCNIYSKGKFTYNDTIGAKGSWSSLSTLANYKIEYQESPGYEIYPNEEDFNISDNDSTKTLFLLPQSLPDNAKINIEITDVNNNTKTLTASLKGCKWEMGKRINYKLLYSHYEPTLIITQPHCFSFQGGTKTFTIQSYETNQVTGYKRAVTWDAEISEDNGDTWSKAFPSWISSLTLNGNGGTNAQTLSVKVAAQTGEYMSTEENNIKNASTVYNVDLSNEASNTANCYIINAPGTYMFPMVYGNAIKNGKTNCAAYKCTSSLSYVLSNLVNHNNQAITSPIIEENNISISKIALLWSDCNIDGLEIINKQITLDGTTNEVKYAKFNVPSSGITQGNAVIAAYDADNKICWSWHIWITDWKLSQSISIVNGGGNYEMMPVNIGWKVNKTTHYPERSIKIKFTQKNCINAKQDTITIKQSERSVVDALCTYYQWGRKDPFYVYNKQNVSTYKYYTSKISARTTLNNSIQMPNTCYFYGTSGSWLSTSYCNLWNNTPINTTTFNHEKCVKTIYDPSPVGYMTPNNGAFAGFTTNTGASSDATTFNIDDEAQYSDWEGYSSFSGYSFYSEPNRSGEKIYIPIVGFIRTQDGNLTITNCLYWTNQFCFTTTYKANYFNSYVDSNGKYWVNPNMSHVQAYGFPVRPIKEK